MFITKDKFLKSLRQNEKDDTIYLIEINNYSGLHDSLGILAIDKFSEFIDHSIFNFIKQSSFMGRVARIGDSLVALHMKNCKDAAASEEFAIQICEAFDKLMYVHEGINLNFSVNVGVLCCNEDKADLTTLLAKVEDSCRRARMIKGNAYVMYGEPSSSLTIDTELGKAVYNALKGGHIKSLYQ